MGCLLFFKQKTAYGMRISDWSSDVCSSDLPHRDAAVDDMHRPLGRDEAVDDVAEPVDHRRQLQMTIGCEGETRARRRLILRLGAPFREALRGRRVEKEGRAEQRRDLFLDLEDRKSTRLNSRH